MAARRFFVCKHCGNMVDLLNYGGGPLECCGSKMEELVPSTRTEDHSGDLVGKYSCFMEAFFAHLSKADMHLPQVSQTGNQVRVAVGSMAHPMQEDHHIQWIYLETDQGGRRRLLQPGQEPVCLFTLSPGERVVAAYAYCNLYGLWLTEL